MMNKSLHARLTAFTALGAALGTLILYMAAVFPSGRLVLIFTASLPATFLSRETTSKRGWALFFLTFFLSLILLPAKLPALLFGFYFGYFPLLKTALSAKWKGFWGAFLLRLIIFNGAMGLLFFITKEWAIGDIPSGKALYALIPALQIVFIALEIALPMAMTLYEDHIRKHLPL
ncbi:MAG TPA: hypothetical protein PLF44_01785 [Candidatus Mcinerneyibacteriales bacterium]|nr:hypothetical protein [Candidatus Mcinerneyibacteriales bacterium]HPE19889.1 hypothetical protein [Candidatus Mcinerneyibacteriales bacterium]HPJ69591.1 hypothetical protein [Candidatus Mcinerneyibacteriales bacterium]HPQ88811.1 hypothetical protein [Candidatus Mcinerneyibacteriales bacterium]